MTLLIGLEMNATGHGGLTDSLIGNKNVGNEFTGELIDIENGIRNEMC